MKIYEERPRTEVQQNVDRQTQELYPQQSVLYAGRDNSVYQAPYKYFGGEVTWNPRRVVDYPSVAGWETNDEISNRDMLYRIYAQQRYLDDLYGGTLE